MEEQPWLSVTNISPRADAIHYRSGFGVIDANYETFLKMPLLIEVKLICFNKIENTIHNVYCYKFNKCLICPNRNSTLF